LLEFVLPKDGYLLLPIDEPEFQDYGPAASAAYPTFFDKLPGDLWDPSVEPCNSRQFEDYTGVDSLASFAISVIVFLTVQTLEHNLGKPLFSFPGMTPYDKHADTKDVIDDTAHEFPHSPGVVAPEKEPAEESTDMVQGIGEAVQEAGA
jgi:hypothetical protein